MGTITFATHDGNLHKVDIIDGKSLMQLATDNAVPGIDGDCGGVCACGTCHVMLESQWQNKIGARSAEEDQMLSMTPERQPTSRLACQIKVSAALNGMTVHLPEFQM